MDRENHTINDDVNYLKEQMLKYTSYWPLFLISVIFFLACSLTYLRYANPYYLTKSKIEILDDSMDKDMALPTAMTIFNRSTVNLENEVESLKSYRIIKNVVQDLN